MNTLVLRRDVSITCTYNLFELNIVLNIHMSKKKSDFFYSTAQSKNSLALSLKFAVTS